MFEICSAVPYFFVVRLGRRIFPQLLVGVFIVQVVAHLNKLFLAIGAGQKDDSDTNSFLIGDLGNLRSRSLQLDEQSRLPVPVNDPSSPPI